jgi:hypothetical protein
VVPADIDNAAGGPTVRVAEIETGTRYRATAYATETDYGVVLADRVMWLSADMLGEEVGRLTDAQRDRVIDGSCRSPRLLVAGVYTCGPCATTSDSFTGSWLTRHLGAPVHATARELPSMQDWRASRR